MSGVFVSYRRDDSQGFAGRLTDDLDRLLGDDRVFRDIEIPIGSDFGDVLRRAIAASDILLVVIGRQWAADSASGFRSRLFEPTDWVRAEIEAAFALGKHVIPVLVGGAPMPSTEELPDSIRALGRRQAAELTDRHWEVEVKQLADRLRSLCPALAEDRPLSAPTSPAEVLHELGERVIDEISARRRPQVRPAANSSSLVGRLVRSIGRGIRKLLTALLVLAAIYVGLRLFGDETVLRNLDACDARLEIAWERLMHYFQRLVEATATGS